MISVRQALLSDPSFLAPLLRKSDVDEITASTGESPVEALTTALEVSRRTFTVLSSDTPVAMFGVADYSEGVGSMWLLGSDELFLKHPITFLRESRRWIATLHEDYPVLWNVVDARNAIHIQWLRWLGCRFTRLHPEYGKAKLPFWEFQHASSLAPSARS